MSVVLFVSAIPAFSQTAHELNTRYGKPFTAYLIRPTLMMTVKYSKAGQVSEMLIAKRIEDNSNPTIAPGIVKEIVEELVPLASRGARVFTSRPLPLGFGTSNGFEDYEKVSIRYETTNIKSAPQCSGTAAIIVKWKNRGRAKALQLTAR